MQKIYDERTYHKKRMLNLSNIGVPPHLQRPWHYKRISQNLTTSKWQERSNSNFCGAIGNKYFRYYNLANAEAITLSGQVSIRWIENKMNHTINKVLKTTDYVIASDGFYLP